MGARLGRLAFHPDVLAVLLLTVLVLGLYLPNLGSYSFWDPWEPHYAQVAKEMADHHTWCDPTYRGQNNWWSKPILPLWLLRSSFLLFSVDGPDAPWLHFAGRLPFVLLALMGVLLTFRWVARLFSRRAGVFSAIILATCPMYALLAHQVMFDMPFVSFCAPAIGTYFLSRSPRGKPIDLVLFFVLTAFAFLSKWLLAFFIPAGIFITYLVLRWDTDFFRRVGKSVWIGSAVIFLLCAVYFFAKLTPNPVVSYARNDPILALLLCVCLLAIALVIWMGKDACSEQGYAPYIFWLGVGLFLVISAPWHVFMVSKHGWPFVTEAVKYHHFSRAAGTIGKPEDAFDVYVQQVAFAVFPWICFLPGALIKLLRYDASDFEGQGKTNLWILLSVLVPFFAFCLFQTKFHHYIFPVIPGIAVILGVYFDRFSQENDRHWMRLLVLFAFPIACVLLVDILHNYKWFVHLFDYYYSWPLPANLNPYPVFGVIGGVWLAIVAWLFFQRRVGLFPFGLMVTTAACLCLFLTAWVIPRVTSTFSLESIYRAYRHTASASEPVGQYNSWLSRSVSFYFDNQVEDLSKSDQPNLQKAIRFLNRPGRSFLILGAGFGRDCKSLLADLRPKVQQQINKSLYVVYDKHPFACLVSTERDPAGERLVAQKVLDTPPADITRLQVDFSDQIQLLGYRLQPKEVKPGQAFTISYFFRCKKKIDEDWLVFIHGDGPQRGSHRVFGDHAPVSGLLPTSEWQPGKIIQDDHEMIVPSNYPYTHFTLWMGFWKGPRRLPVLQSHLHDGNNRVRTARVVVK